MMKILIRNLKYTLLASGIAGASAFAQGFDKNTRIMDLPNDTQLKIRYSLDLEEYSADNKTFYTVTFKDKAVNPLVYGIFDTHVILQTNTHVAMKNESLVAGTYCLDKESSHFETQSFGIDLQDRLFFRTCYYREPAFVIYLNAGYGLRTGDHFNGFRIRDLEDQVGTAMKFVR